MSACPKCQHDNTQKHAVFCLKCGSIIDDSLFSNKSALHTCQESIESFLDSISQGKVANAITSPMPSIQPLFDNTAHIKAMLEAFQAKEENVPEVKDFISRCEAFLSRDNSFQIAFAGTINAGKSTLINALLKGEYASMSVTPETAVLTKFKHGENDEIQVSFYSEAEWQEFFASVQKAGGIFLEEYQKNNADSEKSKWVGRSPITEALSPETLKKYTSAKSPSHYFAKEVLITLKSFPFQRNIVFVDTPGLDDPVDYRSKITRVYIDRANVVLLCVQSKALTGKETDTIFRIFDNTKGKPHKVYVLGTQYELLNSPAKDWQGQKGEWCKCLTSQRDNDVTCFSPEIAERNIFAVSGYIALLLAKHKSGTLLDEEIKQLRATAFKLYDSPEFESHAEDLQSFSNVDYIFTRIKEDVLESTEREIISDAQSAYKNLHRDISAYFKDSLVGLLETFEASQQGIDKINAKISKDENILREVEQEKRDLESMMKSFKSESERLVKELDNEINQILRSIK